ncbi:PRC-barrel domain-containing protein [Oceaniglobus indicus]|uniref:PRC-barrel domain-containing protein n=1 Tax=Oceaniglobus indicus TaxID=2047749 RepID=UPI000C1A5309|nr:PRC-barrel domain-containing protein [Oceaniglobus indicus]
MFDTRHALLAATASLALAAAPAFADTHTTTVEDPDATTMQDAGTAIEDAAETTGQALENAADSTADATAELADDAAIAAGNLADRIDNEWSEIADARMSDLVGANLVTATGEDVGEIENFALQNGNLVALAGIGGFLGLGEHDVALDMSRLAYDRENDNFIVEGYTQEDLENMPQYDDATVTVLENPNMTLREVVAR